MSTKGRIDALEKRNTHLFDRVYAVESKQRVLERRVYSGVGGSKVSDLVAEDILQRQNAILKKLRLKLVRCDDRMEYVVVDQDVFDNETGEGKD